MCLQFRGLPPGGASARARKPLAAPSSWPSAAARTVYRPTVPGPFFPAANLRGGQVSRAARPLGPTRAQHCGHLHAQGGCGVWGSGSPPVRQNRVPRGRDPRGWRNAQLTRTSTCSDCGPPLRGPPITHMGETAAQGCRGWEGQGPDPARPEDEGTLTAPHKCL